MCLSVIQYSFDLSRNRRNDQNRTDFAQTCGSFYSLLLLMPLHVQKGEKTHGKWIPFWKDDDMMSLLNDCIEAILHFHSLLHLSVTFA